MSYVGRMAPSPTGLLHLGHARTFAVAHDRARAAGGVLWLRDEDLDTQRSRAEFAAAMRGDLLWLGLAWDREVRQAERIPAYRAAMETLLAAGAVFPCTCSRRDLQQALAAPHEDSDDEPLYSGRCRDRRNIGEGLMAGTNYRFRVAEGEAVAFLDGNAGAQRFVAGCGAGAGLGDVGGCRDFDVFGDFLVWRKDGLPSYQLACVVDDAWQGVTEVVRGRDLLKSTARQILLQRVLGLRTPRYFHCDLLRDAAGVRLAKRHDALSLRMLRESGMTAAQLRAMF